MEEPIIFWEIVELIRQMPFGDKVRLLEELNSEIEFELRANRPTPAMPERSPRQIKEPDPSNEDVYETRRDSWRTFKYEEPN